MASSIAIDRRLVRSSRATRATVAGTALALAIAADFASGPSVTLLIVYVLVVMFAAWYVGAGFAILVSLVGAAGKFAAERPWETGLLATPVPYWNALARAASFLAITWMVRAKWTRFDRLPEADQDAALQTERLTAGSRRDEIEIRDAEQRRIGRALHDGLSQHLTATLLASKTLEERLVDRSAAEADRARQITSLLSEAMAQVRDVSRCLHPPDLENGLPRALSRLAATTERVSGIPCRVDCPSGDLDCGETVATHLYRIAQEAVNNAVRHARPGHIVITLADGGGHIELSVSDDGIGCAPPAADSDGLGLRTMRERARALGGHLDVLRNPRGGTRVVCRVATASSPHAGTHRTVTNDHASPASP